MTKREREAHEYLSRLLTHYAPELEHVPDLLGLCTQIDTVLVASEARCQELEQICSQSLAELGFVDILMDEPATDPLAWIETIRCRLRDAAPKG